MDFLPRNEDYGRRRGESEDEMQRIVKTQSIYMTLVLKLIFVHFFSRENIFKQLSQLNIIKKLIFSFVPNNP